MNKMKEKIKNKIARKYDFDDWEDLRCNARHSFMGDCIEAMEQFATQQAEERYEKAKKWFEEKTKEAYKELGKSTYNMTGSNIDEALRIAAGAETKK